MSTRRGAGQPRDSGSILVLTLGMVVVTLALVLAVVDASAVFLARRGLAADADAAALAVAQELDRGQVYAAGVSRVLPLQPGAVAAELTQVVALDFPPASYPGYRFAVAGGPGAAVVVVSRLLRLPLVGQLTVTARSSAELLAGGRGYPGSRGRR